MSRIMSAVEIQALLKGSVKPAGVRAKGRHKQFDQSKMNGTERQYAEFLRGRLDRHEILWWRFKPFNLHMAPNLRFEPDFAYLEYDAALVICDVKGQTKNKKTGKVGPWVEDDALVKIKSAAAIFPFRFILTWPITGGWGIREFGGDAEPAVEEQKG